VVRELVPIVSLSVALVVACFTLPAGWITVSIRLFILFYVCLLVRYTRLFVITYRDCLRKMDNFFSGQEAEHLRWVNFSFYAALNIGLLALATSLFPAIHIGVACSVVYLLFYLYFAIRLIRYGFVYRQLEDALSDNSILPEEPQEDKNTLRPAMVNTMDSGLQAWIEEKRFLQSGVTIEDLARRIGTNRSYLSEHINSTKGKSFRQWINELRVEEAMTLLRQYPEMTVSEIAKKVGFVNKSHFGRTFLALAKASPQIWRQKQL
jgi:AraC-like DNA-binding protein